MFGAHCLNGGRVPERTRTFGLRPSRDELRRGRYNTTLVSAADWNVFVSRKTPSFGARHAPPFQGWAPVGLLASLVVLRHNVSRYTDSFVQ